jgi:hypothetical protein
MYTWRANGDIDHLGHEEDIDAFGNQFLIEVRRHFEGIEGNSGCKLPPFVAPPAKGRAALSRLGYREQSEPPFGSLLRTRRGRRSRIPARFLDCRVYFQTYTLL